MSIRDWFKKKTAPTTRQKVETAVDERKSLVAKYQGQIADIAIKVRAEEESLRSAEREIQKYESLKAEVAASGDTGNLESIIRQKQRSEKKAQLLKASLQETVNGKNRLEELLEEVESGTEIIEHKISVTDVNNAISAVSIQMAKESLGENSAGALLEKLQEESCEATCEALAYFEVLGKPSQDDEAAIKAEMALALEENE